MLLTFAIAFLLKHYGTLAAPLSVPESLHADSEAAVFIRDGSLIDDSCRRRVLNIIWSCLATTFACTWISVNVPSRGEGPMTIMRRRVLLMFLSIIAPEVMVLWSFKQWRGAVMIREAVNRALSVTVSGRPWTTAHGHLLQMGGFRLRITMRENFVMRENYTIIRDRPLLSSGILHRRDRSRLTWNAYEREEVPDAARLPQFQDEVSFLQGVLTFDAFKHLLAENRIQFPTITEDEINDRSKGDALSKAFTLIQFTWFIVQIIARSTQGLAITELELTTAAINGLNCATCFFWWSKPRDMRIPVVIQTKAVEQLIAERVHEPERFFLDWEDIVRVPSSTISIAKLLFILRSFKSSLSALRENVFLLFGKVKASPRRIALILSRVNNVFSRSRVVVEDVGTSQLTHSVDIMSSFNSRSSMTNGPHTKVGFNLFFKGHKALTHLSTDQSKVRSLTKSALKLASLPFRFSLYLVDLVIFIPIGSIFSGGPTLSLSTAFNFGFNTDADTETLQMAFYSENTGVQPLISATSIAGALLGVVHCLAWNFTFPTHVEQVIWRAASLGVVGSCFATICSLVPSRLKCRCGFLIWLSAVLAILNSLVYTVARVTLFVLAVISLRSLPSSAFDTIDWVELVPHI